MPRYLVLGSGGREHALAWKLASEPDADVIVAPGNDGISQTRGCRCVDADLSDHARLADLARDERVDLTVVGPEAPLCAGVADFFRERGLAILGPSAGAARLEGSKAFAKEIMTAAGIDTADYRTFDDTNDALEFVASAGHPLVIKADGLAGGKGVVISEDRETSAATLREFMDAERFGAASPRVVVEEFMQGPELSFMVLTDGERCLTLPSSQDHKRVGEGDTGPNTGGMGAVSPAPQTSPRLETQLLDEVVRPVLGELKRRGLTYRGFLYAGLMLTATGPRVLEFNVRLGDPETQALMMGLQEPLGPHLVDAARGELREERTLPGSPACCVVLAAEGYPATPTRGDVIDGLDTLADDDVVVFHAGTRWERGAFVTAGGRVLGVAARGTTPDAARAFAYRAVSEISWRGMHFRRDIGGPVN